MKVLCVFGKYQYGDATRGLGNEYASFIPALEKLGHEVVHFESWDRSCYRDFKDLNESLLKVICNEKPVVMLSVQLGYEIWHETLEIIRKEVATVCWATDDSWKYNEFSRLVGDSYDAMVTTYNYVIPKYHRDNIHNVLLSQWAANSETLLKPLPASKCRYSVSFVGAAHGNRKKQVAELRESGIDIACFGYGWPAGPISAKRIPEIMRESVISLNFSNSRGENQIKARTFEVPGAGGFLLTESSPELEKYFEIGKEIAVFSSTNELISKIKYFLENYSVRDQFAIAGFIRVDQEHTYEARLREVLEYVSAAHARHSKDETHKMSSLENASAGYRINIFEKMLRNSLVMLCVLIWGRLRGPRAARRILFEVYWRLRGQKTYRASGLPGRLFYKES